MDLLKFSASASLFVLAVVICCLIFGKRLPKITFRILWLVILVKLLIPLNMPSSLSVYNLFGREASGDYHTVVAPAENPPNAPIIIPREDYGTAENPVGPFKEEANFAESNFAESNNTAKTPNNANITNNTNKAKNFSIIEHIHLLLAAGGITIFTFAVVTHLKHRRIYATSLPCNEKSITDWVKSHKLHRKYSVRTLDAISTPLTYGIFKPVILLPSDFDFEDESKTDFILTHEFVHIRRFDALLKLLYLAALAVHWFNPLVWAAFVLMNKDIELSCDEEVIKRMGGDCKSRYAALLVDLTQKRRAPFLLLNAFSINSTKERVISIMKFRKTTLTGVIASAAVVVFTVTIFATAPKTPEPQKSDGGGRTASESGIQAQQETVAADILPVLNPLLEDAFGEGAYSVSVSESDFTESEDTPYETDAYGNVLSPTNNFYIRDKDGNVVYSESIYDWVPPEDQHAPAPEGTIAIRCDSDCEFIFPLRETITSIEEIISGAKAGKIISVPGVRVTQYYSVGHAGTDFVDVYGTDIIASADGEVILAQYDNGAYGHNVIIQHENGLKTLYAHCSELTVKEGDKVKQGDVIAKLGSSGRSTGPHLHFEIIDENETRLDPKDYLNCDYLRGYFYYDYDPYYDYNE